MPKVLEICGDYKILSTKRDYIVVNMTLPYEHHAHFKTLNTLKHLIHLIDLGKAPTSPYLLKAAKRLLGDGFNQLQPKRKKQHYSNHHQRMNRQ